MNKKQWYVFGIGFIILSIFLLWSAEAISCILSEGDTFIACYVRRYAYAVPAVILMGLGIIFNICAGLEKKS